MCPSIIWYCIVWYCGPACSQVCLSIIWYCIVQAGIVDQPLVKCVPLYHMVLHCVVLWTRLYSELCPNTIIWYCIVWYWGPACSQVCPSIIWYCIVWYCGPACSQVCPSIIWYCIVWYWDQPVVKCAPL